MSGNGSLRLGLKAPTTVNYPQEQHENVNVQREVNEFTGSEEAGGNIPSGNGGFCHRPTMPSAKMSPKARRLAANAPATPSKRLKNRTGSHTAASPQAQAPFTPAMSSDRSVPASGQPVGGRQPFCDANVMLSHNRNASEGGQTQKGLNKKKKKKEVKEGLNQITPRVTKIVKNYWQGKRATGTCRKQVVDALMEEDKENNHVEDKTEHRKSLDKRAGDVLNVLAGLGYLLDTSTPSPGASLYKAPARFRWLGLPAQLDAEIKAAVAGRTTLLGMGPGTGPGGVGGNKQQKKKQQQEKRELESLQRKLAATKQRIEAKASQKYRRKQVAPAAAAAARPPHLLPETGGDAVPGMPNSCRRSLAPDLESGGEPVLGDWRLEVGGRGRGDSTASRGGEQTTMSLLAGPGPVSPFEAEVSQTDLIQFFPDGQMQIATAPPFCEVAPAAPAAAAAARLPHLLPETGGDTVPGMPNNCRRSLAPDLENGDKLLVPEVWCVEVGGGEGGGDSNASRGGEQTTMFPLAGPSAPPPFEAEAPLTDLDGGGEPVLGDLGSAVPVEEAEETLTDIDLLFVELG